jgi:hypothetical protein
LNSLLTIELITLESLRVLTNMLTFTGLVNRQFDSMFGKSGAKVGDVIYARKPPRYIVRKGAGIQPQATTETRTPVKLSELAGVDLPFSSVERTLSLDNYSDRILKPVLASIANQIDYDGLLLYKDVYNLVGTPGAVPSSTTANGVYLGAGVKLDDMSAPQDDQRYIVSTPNMQASVVAANLAVFNPQQTISEGFRKGRFGKGVLGFDWYMDQNCPTHTEGTRTGVNGSAWSVSGADQTGNSLLITGLTSGNTVNKGDVFTIGTIAGGNGVQSVNPQSRQATGALQQFVCTQTVTSGGSTDTIPIEPAITISGQFQTVDRSPASGAYLTFAGTSALVNRYGMAFHRDAFTLVTAPLELPKGVHEAYYAGDDQTGVGVRIVTAFDIRTNEMITRFDVLYGWASLRPELACRIGS